MRAEDRKPFEAGLVRLLQVTNGTVSPPRGMLFTYWKALNDLRLEVLQSAMARLIKERPGHISPALIRATAFPTVTEGNSQHYALAAEREAAGSDSLADSPRERQLEQRLRTMANAQDYELMRREASNAYARRLLPVNVRAPAVPVQYTGAFDYRPSVAAAPLVDRSDVRAHERAWSEFHKLLDYEWNLYTQSELAGPHEGSPSAP